MPHALLRDAVPEQLAKWLDAQAADGSEFGLPGHSGLRAAWASDAAPTPELVDDIATWVETWVQIQRDSEQTYAKLLTVEGFEPDRIPGWYFEPWAQVLLSMPWDERLPDAIDAAEAYCADLVP